MLITFEEKMIEICGFHRWVDLCTARGSTMESSGLRVRLTMLSLCMHAGQPVARTEI